MLLFLAQTVRIAIPYLFAAAGGAIAERAGIVSLTLEGFMLGGAFGAVLGAYYTGSAVARGSRAASRPGSASARIHAVASIRFKADQVVVGVAINLFAVGITRFFLQLAFQSSSNSPRVAGFGVEYVGRQRGGVPREPARLAWARRDAGARVRDWQDDGSGCACARWANIPRRRRASECR